MKKEIEIRGEKVEVFVIGEYLGVDKKAVAIVGSRKMTSRGMWFSYKFGYELAKNGVTVVSGLALGIDSVAHKAALDAHWRTIAVLAHGLDKIYPKENRGLAKRIIQNGCLVTKFAEGTVPLRENFLKRNRLIAGLSKVVVVIEGAERSGSLSTANHAADLGIEVFAVPGSPATDFLIKEGANKVEKPEEILEYLARLD